MENLPMKLMYQKVNENIAMQTLESKIEKLDLLNSNETKELLSTHSLTQEFDIGVSIERTVDDRQETVLKKKPKLNIKWKKFLMKYLRKKIALIFKKSFSKKLLKKLGTNLSAYMEKKASKNTDKYKVFLKRLVAKKKDFVRLMKNTNLKKADQIAARKMIKTTINKYVVSK
jgi:hypothetical protein